MDLSCAVYKKVPAFVVDIGGEEPDVLGESLGRKLGRLEFAIQRHQPELELHPARDRILSQLPF